MKELQLFSNINDLEDWARHYGVCVTTAQAIRDYIFHETGGEPDETEALRIVNVPENEERKEIEKIAIHYARTKRETSIRWKKDVIHVSLA